MAPKLETAVLMRLLRNRTDAISRVSFGSSTALTAQKTGLPKCLRKQTFTVLVGMSQRCHVWTAPCWQELSSRLQHWSVQPCVRPINAVHMTAGHNALRGSGPDQQLAFKNAMARVGCPDRRIDRLCITCCSPSQPSHHASCPTRFRLSRKREGFLVSLAPWHHGPDHRAILLASAIAATLVGRRASKAVSQGRCLVPWILA